MELEGHKDKGIHRENRPDILLLIILTLYRTKGTVDTPKGYSRHMATKSTVNTQKFFFQASRYQVNVK